MAPLSLMLLPRLNLKPDDIEGCHYCIDLWNGCFDCDADARLFTTLVSVGGLDPARPVVTGQGWPPVKTC